MTGLYAESHGIVANVGLLSIYFLSGLIQDFFPRLFGTRSIRKPFNTLTRHVVGMPNGGLVNRLVVSPFKWRTFADYYSSLMIDLGNCRQSWKNCW